MGRRNSTCRGRLPVPDVRHDDSTLTRFAGAIPLVAFMSQELRLLSRLRGVVRYRGRRRRYGVHVVLFAFVVAALVGVRRMAHLDWLSDDAVLLKWLRLPSWPVRKVFSQALRHLDECGRRRLEELVCDLGFRALGEVDSVVVDVDPTAIVDHGRGEGSRFGYCGKGRRRRRHYPLVASVGEGRAIVATEYRGGENVTGPERVAFFRLAAQRVRDRLGEACDILFRGDSGMWSNALLDWMLEQRIGFAFAIGMQPKIRQALHNASWVCHPDDEEIEFTAIPGPAVGMAAGVRVIGIRRLDDDLDNPAQGKLLPGCQRYRYQALITDRDWEPLDVWRFYNHRADCERVFRVGKQALGLGNLVGRDYAANATAFLLRALAFNVDLLFQRAAEQRARDAGRPVRHVGLEWRQFRFYRSPGRLLREHNRWVLRTPTNRLLAQIWGFYRPLMVLSTSEAVG